VIRQIAQAMRLSWDFDESGRLIMDRKDLRNAVEELMHAYIECIDDDRLEEWPDFFTEDCLYRVVPRENFDRDLPIALMHCDSRGMLRDRVTAHRKANLFAPHHYRHVVSAVRVTGWENEMVTARSNYAVFRTSTDPISYGTTELYGVGEYRNKIAMIDGVLKFKEKIVILDTSRIQSLLVTPL
jgi:anthranilate 1,2-dioxygenase small subunit